MNPFTILYQSTVETQIRLNNILKEIHFYKVLCFQCQWQYRWLGVMFSRLSNEKYKQNICEAWMDPEGGQGVRIPPEKITSDYRFP